MGLKIGRSYFVGVSLCLLLFTSAVSADLKRLTDDKELEQAYALLFSESEKIKQASRVKKKRSSQLNTRKRVILSAKRQLRKMYRWGGSSPRTGFDCSGLIQYAFKSIKIDIPRTAKAQYKHAKPIPLSKLQAGDLIFFHTRRTKTRVNHVGLYLGDGKFIHAPRRGKRVSVAKLNKYWRRKAVAAGRI